MLATGHWPPATIRTQSVQGHQTSLVSSRFLGEIRGDSVHGRDFGN